MASSGDWLGVINYVNDLSKNDNLRGELLVLRAKAYFMMNNYEMAMSDFNKLLEVNKRNPKYFELRADTWIALKNFKQAEKDLSKAISIQVDCFELYKKRAICRIELNQNEMALQDINLLLELFPGKKDVLLLMIQVNSKENQYLKALTGINFLLSEDSLNARYFLARAEIYEKAGINHQAGKDYDKSIQLAPSNPAILLARGKYYFHLNNFKAACADWKKAEIAGSLEAGRLKFENCGK